MLIEKLKEGDVIYANCTDNVFCYHIGIVYDDGKKKLIYHLMPDLVNRYGGNVIATSYEDFMKGRVPKQVRSTNAKNEDILRVARKCKSEPYDGVFFNCEDFVLEITDGRRRSDVRDAYKIVLLTATILLFI
jgi:hypothetical protein